MAKKSSFQPQPTGMIWVASYGVLFVCNAVVLWLANWLFPNQVVLGTMTINVIGAIALSMGVFSLIGLFVIPFVRLIENRNQTMFTPRDWMVLYLIVNVVGIWVLGRFAEQLGMGIASWMVAVALGAVMDVVQGIGMMWLEKYREKLV